MADDSLKPDFVFYHAPCIDGLVAAWVLRNHFGQEDVQYIPFNYGDEFPLTTQWEGKHVLFVDVSLPRNHIIALARVARDVTILDHHKTARAELEGLEALGNVLAKFDMGRSGAGLAWWYVNGDRDPAPRIVQLVEDRDLWKFEHDPETTWMHRVLEAYPLTFDAVDNANQILESGDIESIGRTLDSLYRGKVERLAERASTISITGFDVPIVECEKSLASDVAHSLLQRHPEAPFAACYCREKGVGRMSLRSEDSRVDVSEIAKSFGGGGHRNAAGFQMDFDTFWPKRVL